MSKAKKSKGPIKRIDREKVLELHDRGFGVTAIARELGCSKGSISKILKALGVQVVKANVQVATRYVEKKNTAADHLEHLAGKLRDELDWIEQTVPPKNTKEYRDWQDQKIKFAAEMRKLIRSMGDIAAKIYQAQHVQEVLAIVIEEVGGESPACRRRIIERIKTQRDIELTFESVGD